MCVVCMSCVVCVYICTYACCRICTHHFVSSSSAVVMFCFVVFVCCVVFCCCVSWFGVVFVCVCVCSWLFVATASMCVCCVYFVDVWLSWLLPSGGACLRDLLCVIVLPA